MDDSLPVCSDPSESREIHLQDGRLLEYQEYGDPQGEPILFFHGLIGSHHQASYIAKRAAAARLRVIAPNRPGVGRSTFVRRSTPRDAVPDVEALAEALGLENFSVIGISGGTPYALATLYQLSSRIRTTTILSGLGPVGLRRGLEGMDRRRQLFLKLGSRFPGLALSVFEKVSLRYHADPEAFLKRLVRTWSGPDRELFRSERIFALFLRDLEEVFHNGNGAIGLAQELSLYRHYGFPLAALPADRAITLWQGLDDTIVPRAMAWSLLRHLPSAEAHFVPGGHFVAVTIADRVIADLRRRLDNDAQAGHASGPVVVS